MSDVVPVLNEALRAALIAMAAADHRVREELAREGTLFLGYHPRMAEVHHHNAVKLTLIMDAMGWPSMEVVGTDGCDAAWLILQHSIGDPSVMRRGLALLQAAPGNTVAPAQLAMLEDRVRSMSGLPQRYGTQFDWNEDGMLGPREIEDASGVDERRRAVGLPPLGEKLREMREQMARAGQLAPSDFAERRRMIEQWEISVGWHA